jgi:hypothetical protein
MAVACFIICPKEVVLDRGREDNSTPEMTQKDSPLLKALRLQDAFQLGAIIAPTLTIPTVTKINKRLEGNM